LPSDARTARWAALAAAGALGAAAWAALDPARGGLAVLLAAVAVVVAGFAWFESKAVTAHDVTLVATLGGLAAAGRILFAPVPNVQPVTVMVAAAGVALGPRRGFAVGALAALASNMVLGQGAHTPWQMLAWGGCGLAAGLARPLLRRRLSFAVFCLLLGFAFGLVMNVWNWYAFLPHTWAALVASLGPALAFDTAHALGNFVLALAVGPELRRVLERFERRTRAVVVWS
jgi:energy-coupling factor transport system substrate-specific component